VIKFPGFVCSTKLCEREMEAVFTMILMLILILVLIWAWRMLNWLWFTPKRLERLLREQGLQGNPYTLFVGDMNEFAKMRKEAFSKPMNLFSHDIVPRVSSYIHHCVNTHGMLVVPFCAVFLQLLLCLSLFSSSFVFLSTVWLNHRW